MDFINLKSLNLTTEESEGIIKFLAQKREITTKNKITTKINKIHKITTKINKTNKSTKRINQITTKIKKINNITTNFIQY